MESGSFLKNKFPTPKPPMSDVGIRGKLRENLRDVKGKLRGWENGVSRLFDS